jgi:DNA-binding HxlR family transcriptional regulator
MESHRITSSLMVNEDLSEGLSGISTHLLSERLRSLEQASLLQRRVLPPPAAPSVYELTGKSGA